MYQRFLYLINRFFCLAQGNIAKKALAKLILQLEKEIKKVDKKIADLIADYPQLKEKMELLTSIKGVGQLWCT